MKHSFFLIFNTRRIDLEDKHRTVNKFCLVNEPVSPWGTLAFPGINVAEKFASICSAHLFPQSVIKLQDLCVAKKAAGIKIHAKSGNQSNGSKGAVM